MVQLSHPHETTGKTTALTHQSESLLFDTLSRFVIVFQQRSSHLISWLQLPYTAILEPKKGKSVTAPTFSPFICPEVMGPDAMILGFFFLNIEFYFFPLLFHTHQEAL